MRKAMFVSGHLRSMCDLKQIKSEFDGDIFVATWDREDCDPNSPKIDQAMVLKDSGAVAVEFANFDTVLESMKLKNAYIEKYCTFKAHDHKGRHGYDSFCMFYIMQRAWLLLKAYERKMGFKYDTVVRFRPDHVFVGLPPNFQPEENKVYFPQNSIFFNLTDNLFVAERETMEKMMLLPELLDTYLLKEDVIWTHEFLMAHHIQKQALGIDKIATWFYKCANDPIKIKPKWEKEQRGTIIYDCLMFFNEFEILKIRLNELYSVVDKFIIVEANKTHSNEPKSSWLQEKKHLFSQWSDKMVVVTAAINETVPAKIEQLQRQAIWEVLKDTIRDKDIMMLSDADEIPSATSVKAARQCVDQGDVCFIQDVYQYYLNCRVNRGWKGTRMAKAATIREMNGSMQYFRHKKATSYLENAGWHFGFMGGSEQIKLKIQSFYHTELNEPKFTEVDKINMRMQAGADPFDRWKQTPEIVPLDQMPAYVRDNPHIFASWLQTP